MFSIASCVVLIEECRSRAIVSGCVVASVCIVVETVGLPIAFCMALVPGLKSCLILCAVLCLICSFCIFRSSFVRVCWRVVAACVSCFKMSVVSVCWGLSVRCSLSCIEFVMM